MALEKSDSPSVHEIAYAALLALYRFPELILLLDDSIRNQRSPCVRKRLFSIRARVYQKDVQDQSVRFEKLLIRYGCVKEYKALLEMHREGEKGWDCLDHILRSERQSPMIRFWAAKALKEMREPYCENLLEKHIQGEKGIEKIFSSLAFGNMPENVAKEGLLCSCPFVRAQVLSFLPDNFPASFVERYLDDPDFKVTLSAASFLRKLGNEKAEEILARCFSHPSASIRKYALYEYWNLSRIKQRLGEALPPLEWITVSKCLRLEEFALEELGLPFHPGVEGEKVRMKLVRGQEEWVVEGTKTEIGRASCRERV